MNTSIGILERIFVKTGFKKPSVAKDRRRSKRYRVDLPIKFRVYLRSRPEMTTDQISARLFDISEHGVGMLIKTLQFDTIHITKLDAQTSEECLLEIWIPFDPDPVVLKGKMVWYIQTPEHQPFVLRVGVSLMDQSPARTRKLKSFINICMHAGEMNT
jgi:c-di-GMP-binding flagellar brake protein YcgR